MQLARRLLDKGAGAAAARGLHVDLLGLAVTAGGEEERLHVLAADLEDEVDLRVQLLDRGRHSDHFLHHLAAEKLLEHAGTGAGEEDAVALRREAALGLHAPEELEHHFRLLGAVALVVLPANLAVLADRGLDRGRSDVEPDDQHETRCRAKLAAVLAATPERGT